MERPMVTQRTKPVEPAAAGGSRSRRRKGSSGKERHADVGADGSPKYTTFEIATYAGAHKELSIVGGITMDTAMKILALVGKESTTEVRLPRSRF
jgi:hypothetical protein